MTCTLCGTPTAGPVRICRRCEREMVAESDRDATTTAHERNRQRLEAEIQAFLERGGQVTTVDPSARAHRHEPFRGSDGTVSRRRV